MLLEGGADPNLYTLEGYMALEMAAGGGHVDCVEALIQAGAQVNGFRLAGRNAVHFAAQQGQLEAVRTLLRFGADPNLRTPGPLMLGYLFGVTPLMEAARKGQAEVARELIRAGADAGARRLWRGGWQTAAKLAKENGHMELVAILSETSR